jgi:hypothetical protein
MLMESKMFVLPFKLEKQNNLEQLLFFFFPFCIVIYKCFELYLYNCLNLYFSLIAKMVLSRVRKRMNNIMLDAGFLELRS